MCVLSDLLPVSSLSVLIPGKAETSFLCDLKKFTVRHTFQSSHSQREATGFPCLPFLLWDYWENYLVIIYEDISYDHNYFDVSSNV